jgi:hypothetical protein
VVSLDTVGDASLALTRRAKDNPLVQAVRRERTHWEDFTLSNQNFKDRGVGLRLNGGTG